MKGPTKLSLALITLLLMSSDAVPQVPCPQCVTDPWVKLTDARGAVRGGLRIVGQGEQATVQIRDASGVILSAPFGRVGQTKPQMASLQLEPYPDPIPEEKADANDDIKNLQRQITTLQRNVKALQDRVNAQR